MRETISNSECRRPDCAVCQPLKGAAGPAQDPVNLQQGNYNLLPADVPANISWRSELPTSVREHIIKKLSLAIGDGAADNEEILARVRLVCEF